MKRKLLLLNLALVALTGLAAWRARQAWLDAERHEQAVLRVPQKPVPPPPFAPLPPVGPLAAVAYEEVAQQMLFTPDRNPTVVVEPAKPEPVPPLPVAYGVLNLGEGPLAVLSEKANAPHRAVPPGAAIGPFKLLSVTSDELVFEWKGRKIARKVEELRSREGEGASPAGGSGAAAVNVPPPPQAVVQVAPERPLGPGEGIGAVRACQAGDSSPPGAVVQGFRKVVSRTPFGTICRWEPVQ